jgi:hypothetical protein
MCIPVISGRSAGGRSLWPQIFFGAVAQLVERIVRNDEVGSSTLLRSTFQGFHALQGRIERLFQAYFDVSGVQTLLLAQDLQDGAFGGTIAFYSGSSGVGRVQWI